MKEIPEEMYKILEEAVEKSSLDFQLDQIYNEFMALVHKLDETVRH